MSDSGDPELFDDFGTCPTCDAETGQACMLLDVYGDVTFIRGWAVHRDRKALILVHPATRPTAEQERRVRSLRRSGALGSLARLIAALRGAQR